MYGLQERRDVRIREADVRLLLALRPELQLLSKPHGPCPCACQLGHLS